MNIEDSNTEKHTGDSDGDRTDELTNESTAVYTTTNPGEPDLEEYYWKLRSYVQLVTSKEVDALMIEAKAGIGKSYTIVDELKQSVGLQNFVKASGYCSPLALYHKLYSVHDGGILFLDDVAGIPTDERSLELLKQATWSEGETRSISWDSTSDKVEAPRSFEFTGGIIMVFNEVPDGVMFRALHDRCMSYNLAFTYAERIHIMREVAKSPYKHLSYEERTEVVDYIEDNSGPGDEVNLRTMIKIFDIRCGKPDRWKLMAEDQLDPDQELKMVRQLLDDHDTVSAACEEFMNTTEQSRATFFRRKKKITTDAESGA